MEWYKHTDETHTAIDGEFVIILRRTRHITTHAVEVIGEWTGRVMTHDGTVMMSAEDKSRGVVVAACQAWLLALSVARERDPAPTS